MEEKKIKITEFTDALCFWCYGIEPIMRKVEYLLGDKMELHYITGLLVGDMHDIVGRDELADVRFEKTKADMADHLVKGAARCKVPIDTSYLDDAGIDDISSAPLNMAYKAFHIQDPDHAHAFMRRMREATYNEGRLLTRPGELAKLAGEFDIDVDRFEHDRTSDIVEEIFSQDLVTTSKHNVRTYPSFSIMYDGKSLSATGYCEFAFFQKAVDELTEGTVKLETPAFSLAAAAKFVSTYKRVMEREIQVLFDLDDEALADCVAKLVESGAYEREARGNGFYVKEKETKPMCDPVTGACSVI